MTESADRVADVVLSVSSSVDFNFFDFFAGLVGIGLGSSNSPSAGDFLFCPLFGSLETPLLWEGASCGFSLAFLSFRPSFSMPAYVWERAPI